jgi:glycosyltransferase involved in cell wall biosynthesis
MLRIVGSGSLHRVVEELVRGLPSQTTWSQRLRTDEVVAALDAATLLVLPSRSEGMGRVVVEALLRGRPVVASRVGGIPDLVPDGQNGLLVEPEDTEALAGALVRLLSDRGEAERLAARARASAERFVVSPDDWAEAVRGLVERVAR